MNKLSKLFTIGHSTHEIEKFISLLDLHSIEAIADVRSYPYSKFNPQFNREVLQKALSEKGIKYVFLGEEFGARRAESQCYVNNIVDYDLVSECVKFKEGIKRIVDGAESLRIALMCAEKDPLTCHRTILVARHLDPLFENISHILEDGSLEGQAEAEIRLRKENDLYEGSLLSSESEQLSEAYKKREREIAYKEADEDMT